MKSKNFLLPCTFKFVFKRCFPDSGAVFPCLKVNEENPPHIGWLLHIKLIADVAKLTTRLCVTIPQVCILKVRLNRLSSNSSFFSRRLGETVLSKSCNLYYDFEALNLLDE